MGLAPQFGASLAAGARGQVELAFLDGRTGSLLPMASASRTPLPAFGEAWSSNVTLSTTPIDPTIGLPAGAPQLSPHPISVASLALDDESNLDPLPVSRHALAAWTDTRSVATGPQAENRDLHAVVLRHGSTLPTLGQPEYPISKRAIKDLQLAIVDPDGDPVQMLLLDSPSTAIVPNENLPFLHYTSPATTGKEFLRVSLSDGKGRSSIVEFIVSTFNSPPIFDPACGTLKANYETAFWIDGCASDVDHDPIVYGLEGTAHGNVVPKPTGWHFQPDKEFYGLATFTLVATDGEAIATLPVKLDVGLPKDVLAFVIAAPNRAIRGRAVSFSVKDLPLQKKKSMVEWRFGDGTQPLKAPGDETVHHRYVKTGAFTITATISGTPRTAKVTVQAPPVEVTGLKWKNGRLQVSIRTGVPGKVSALLSTAKAQSTTTKMLSRPRTLTRQARAGKSTMLALKPPFSRTRRLGHLKLTVMLKPSGEVAIGPLKITRLVPIPARR